MDSKPQHRHLYRLHFRGLRNSELAVWNEDGFYVGLSAATLELHITRGTSRDVSETGVVLPESISLSAANEVLCRDCGEILQWQNRRTGFYAASRWVHEKPSSCISIRAMWGNRLLRAWLLVHHHCNTGETS